MKLLHLDSSALGPQSVTRELTAAIVGKWRNAHPGLSIAYRDLDHAPLPHLAIAELGKTDLTRASAAEAVLQQFLEADVIVIGAPMYNFGIPSTLKAWIDRIAVAGRTFRYTGEGPEGLAGGKQIIIATSSGGVHAGGVTDFVEPYLRQLFGFLGVTDVSFVRAQGVALSAEHRSQAIDEALEAIPQPWPLAA